MGEEKGKVSALNTCFCGHYVYTTNAAQKGLNKAETGYFAENPPVLDKTFSKTDEYGYFRLIRSLF